MSLAGMAWWLWIFACIAACCLMIANGEAILGAILLGFPAMMIYAYYRVVDDGH